MPDFGTVFSFGAFLSLELSVLQDKRRQPHCAKNGTLKRTHQSYLLGHLLNVRLYKDII